MSTRESKKAKPGSRYRPQYPMFAGALTGGIEIMITFPLEFIKVQLQLQHHYRLKEFRGPLDCALFTIKEKGPLGLYKGLSPWLVFALPRSAVRFSTYEYVSHALQSDGRKLDPLYAMLAGTIAGSMEFATIGTPMQCIQIKMAHDAYSAQPKFRGFMHAAMTIIRDEGFWRGMYAGVGPTVLKGGVNNCIRFSTFNEMKHLYEEYRGRRRDSTTTDSQESNDDDGITLNFAESFLLGSISGGISAICTHPIDSVKTNVQALGGGGYTSSYDCLKSIIQTQGILGLYKGLLPRFIRVCLEIGIHFTLYERIARRLDKMW